MKKPDKVRADEPGPGQYIDMANPKNSSVCKNLLKLAADRSYAEANGVKIGPFGTSAKRFEKSPFDPPK
jgi:hypothetical protein